MLHRLAAAVAALAVILVLAAPALAGGWAEIVADAQTTEPPVEGRPVEVGFLVLQHGQTPAGWETPTVHFTNISTGATIDAVATNDRADGHFVASVVLPDAGAWSWQVTLKDLISEHQPVALTVVSGTATVPANDPGGFAGQPLLVVLTVAVLVVAVAGVAMARRAGRPRPSVTFSPAPREVDQA
jgi:hypothetical protein